MLMLFMLHNLCLTLAITTSPHCFIHSSNLELARGFPMHLFQLLSYSVQESRFVTQLRNT